MRDTDTSPVDEVATFEAAHDILSTLIGLATAPDAPSWAASRATEWARRRSALTPSDKDALREILEHDSVVLRDLLGDPDR